VQPHEYVRGGTAKLLTLFHPASGLLRAKGVLSAPNAVLHPWMQDQVQSILDQLDKKPLPVRVPLPDDHPLLLTWQHWWWSYERPKPAPALRLILSLSTIWLGTCRITWCAGCSNTAFCRSTRPCRVPGSTWPSRCNASSCAAPSPGSIRKTRSPVIDWLEQTVAGWNQHPTPFVWNGKRRRRRERARLRRLGGSGAAVLHGYSIAS
jgi:hypothetical protein